MKWNEDAVRTDKAVAVAPYLASKTRASQTRRNRRHCRSSNSRQALFFLLGGGFFHFRRKWSFTDLLLEWIKRVSNELLIVRFAMENGWLFSFEKEKFNISGWEPLISYFGSKKFVFLEQRNKKSREMNLKISFYLSCSGDKKIWEGIISKVSFPLSTPCHLCISPRLGNFIKVAIIVVW